MSESYVTPPHGWTCYHWGETFSTWGSAEDHFGKTPADKPGCLIKVQYGDERGLEMELRKEQARSEELLQRVIAAEESVESLQGQLAAWEQVSGCRTAHDLWCRLDSITGKILVMREKLATAGV